MDLHSDTVLMDYLQNVCGGGAWLSLVLKTFTVADVEAALKNGKVILHDQIRGERTTLEGIPESEYGEWDLVIPTASVIQVSR